MRTFLSSTPLCTRRTAFAHLFAPLLDSSPKNKHWTRYAAIFPLAEVNLMERQLLFLLDFDLRMDEAELLEHFEPFLPRHPVASTSQPHRFHASRLDRAAFLPRRVDPLQQSPRRKASTASLATPPPSSRRSSYYSSSYASSESSVMNGGGSSHRISPSHSNHSSASSMSPITPVDEPSQYPGLAPSSSPSSRRVSYGDSIQSAPSSTLRHPPSLSFLRSAYNQSKILFNPEKLRRSSTSDDVVLDAIAQ